MAVLRRRRQSDWGDAPAEPIKIIEPETTEPAEPEDAMEGAERSARAASSRTDYEAVCERFKGAVTNRKSAIRAMCVTCMGGAVYEVARCTSSTCPLFPYRMGEDPNDARTIKAKEKREAQAAALAAKPKPAARRSRG